MVQERDFHRAVAIYYRKRPSSCRLGQYLINRLAPEKVDPEVFYEEDEYKAYRLFYERYVKKESGDEPVDHA